MSLSSHSNATNFEDLYSIPDDSIINRDNFVIISGCSGSGKSTLLSELCKKDYLCIPEPGRQIVKEQNSIGGDGLPWINPMKFMELTLSRYIYTFNTAQSDKQWIFFDRGIPDAISHVEYLQEAVPSYLTTATQKFRYNSKVFMTPPWPEIYRNDSERKHSYEEAVSVYESTLVSFRRYGYEIIIVPKDEVQNRVRFIFEELEKK